MAEQPSKKASNKTNALIIVLIVCVVALIGVVGFAAYRMGEQKESQNIAASTESQKRDVIVTEDNVDEVVKQLEESVEKVAPGSYEVTMTTNWHFADGKSASIDSYVENSTANTNDIYFDILLGDSEEMIYSSPVIPVGKSISNITLDKELEAGSYDCVMVYSLLDTSQNVLSTVRVAFTIVID